MLCSKCNTFKGAPCDVCRTLSRLTFFVQTGRLQPRDEELILQTLRQSAGILSDLVERGEKDKFGAVGTKKEEEPDKEEEKKEEQSKAEASKESISPEKERKSHHKEDKKKKKKEKKEKLEAVSSTERHKERERKSRESSPDAPEDRESLRAAKASKLEETEETEEERRNRLAIEAAVLVESHPEQIGLRSWPERDRAENRREVPKRPVFRGSEPAEPRRAPRPPHHDEEIPRRRTEGPRKKRARGTKGAGHRERGQRYKASAWKRFSR